MRHIAFVKILEQYFNNQYSVYAITQGRKHCINDIQLVVQVV